MMSEPFGVDFTELTPPVSTGGKPQEKMHDFELQIVGNLRPPGTRTNDIIYMLLVLPLGASILRVVRKKSRSA
jgi:hypothetical protein